MLDFYELEYKYKADNISYPDFETIMNTLKIEKQDNISSWDYYFTDSKKQDEGFIRFRDSTISPELTRKIKTQQQNNFVRMEIDLPLDKTKINLKTITYFLQSIDYHENFRIYKNCQVFWLDSVNYVYYTVYGKEGNKLNCFIEVEVNKAKMHSLGMEQAQQILDKATKPLQNLGLSSQNRMKRSLYELYKVGF